MKKLLLVVFLITTFLTSVRSQIYSDLVYNYTSCAGGGTCTGFVLNAQHVADSSQTNYATIFNGLGIGNVVMLEYGFSTPAPGGSLVGVTLQKGNQTLSAGILSNITIQLFNSAGSIVGQKNGLQLEDLGLLGGVGNTPAYAVSFFTAPGNYDIARVRVTLGGTLNVLNDIRVYNAFYLSPAVNGSGKICGLDYANTLTGSSCSGLLCSVVDAQNAADTLDLDDYAVLNIPVGLIGVLGNADLRLKWDTPGDSGQYVGFIIGQNNMLLNLALLSNINITLYDAGGNAVYTKTGFSTVDLTLLSGSSQKSIVGFYAPVHFASARIQLVQVVGLLTSVRVYGAIKFDATPDIVDIGSTSLSGLCSGDSVLLTATPGYDQYFWSTGETTQSITVTQSGTYSLTALDADACLYYSNIKPVTIHPQPIQPVIANIVANPTTLCNGDSAIISVISPFPHVFSTGQTDSSITITNAGNYYVSVTDTNGCSATSDTLTIFAETATVNITGTDSSTCFGSAITLIADGTYAVSWSTGAMGDSLTVTPSVNSTYTAVTQSPNGCLDSASVAVTVNPLPPQPTLYNLPSDTLVLCNGASQTLNLGSVPGNYSVLWSNGDIGNSTSVSAAGNYYVTITDSIGCSNNSDTVNVITDIAQISLVSADTATCAGNQISIVVTANGTVGWSDGSAGNAFFDHPSATTLYTATVTTALNCQAQIDITVNVSDTPPTATALDDESQTTSGIPTDSLDIAANDVYTGTANWMILSGPFNGTATINGNSITYMPGGDFTGKDSIAYVICASNGCGTVCDTAIVTFVVDKNPPAPNNPDTHVKIPGGLSPNGDGTNDILVIEGLENYPGNQITVLNRWGDILFKAKPYYNDWSGNATNGLVVNNAPLPDGTYYYVLDLGDGSKPMRGFIEIRK